MYCQSLEGLVRVPRAMYWSLLHRRPRVGQHGQGIKQTKSASILISLEIRVNWILAGIGNAGSELYGTLHHNSHFWVSCAISSAAQGLEHCVNTLSSREEAAHESLDSNALVRRANFRRT